MNMLERVNGEPVLTHGLVLAILNLGLAFGLNVSGDQLAAINTVVLAFLSWYTRSKVTPVV
jgi:hypothetical protein